MGSGEPRYSASRVRVFTPEHCCHPRSLEDIVALVKRAEGEGARIRAAGSGHSFSDVTFVEGYLVLPDFLRNSLPLDRSRLKPSALGGAPLVHLQSGATIRDINRGLDAAGLALENMGGYDAQTIVGAVSTGTHGSGLKYGPLAAQVASLCVVSAGGEVHQVEPSEGITDPRRFPGHVETEGGPVPAKLVQDDDWFNAAVVSMGCMGIVYSVVLRVTKKFWLRERRSLRAWSELTAPDGFLTRLSQGQEPADHCEILVNPYPTKQRDGHVDHSCVVTERWRLPAPTRSDSGDQSRDSDVAPQFARDFNLDALILPAVFDAPRRKERLDNASRLLDMTLRSLVGPHGYADYESVSYRVFHLGVTNELRAYAVEIAFDLKDAVRAAERVFAIAAKRGSEDGLVHTSPISLRFVKAADAYLAPQHGRDTVMFELPALVKSEESRVLLRGYEIDFLQAAEFDRARPHWGLDLDALQDRREVERLYPKFPQWESVYRRLDARGAFDNHFTDRIGLSVRPRALSAR